MTGGIDPCQQIAWPLTRNYQLHDRLTDDLVVQPWPDLRPCNGKTSKATPSEPPEKADALRSVWSPRSPLLSAVWVGHWLWWINCQRGQWWQRCWRSRRPSRWTGPCWDKNLQGHSHHVQENISLQPRSGRNPLWQPDDHHPWCTLRPHQWHHQGALLCHQKAWGGRTWTPNLQAFHDLPQALFLLGKAHVADLKGSQLLDRHDLGWHQDTDQSEDPWG